MERERGGLALTLCAPRFVGYLDCELHTRLKFRIENSGKKPRRVTLLCEGELTVPFEREAEVPPMSALEVEEDLFAPRFLAENDTLQTVRIAAWLKGLPCTASADVTVLPFDVWEGTEGDAARLAAFVRPQDGVCEGLCGEIKRRRPALENGYEGAGNARLAFSALTALLARTRVRGEPLNAPCRAWKGEGERSALETAVLACSCLERMGFNPLLAVGDGHAAFGVWLFDSALCERVETDAKAIRTYLTAGARNLLFCPAEVLGPSYSPAAAEARFLRNAERGAYRFFVDIRRCRESIPPCPVRVQEGGHYELVRGQRTTFPLRGDVRAWEKRLLDFSARNPLLRFTGAHALHVACGDAEEMLSSLEEPLRLVAGRERPPFAAACGQERAQCALERAHGVLCVHASPKETAEVCRFLMRRDRAEAEETGARGLCLAVGFLRYREHGEERRAPLALVPVELAGEEEVTLSRRGEALPNVTLLEYLKKTFRLQIPMEEGLFAAVRKVAEARGFAVEEEAYLAAFSFRRFHMWNDLHVNGEKFLQNANVRALLGGNFQGAAEGDAEPLLPLQADSSQVSAVARAARGESFVLYGPPGTGKSQTIANILADALARGKRVLFVSEKKAARDVVLARLGRAGLADFCLELHAGKADADAVIAKIAQTLSVSAEEPVDLAERKAAYDALYTKLSARAEALHRRRASGFSVYGAILCALSHEDLPDLPDAGGTFYATLTAEKYARCRAAVLRAARAAKMCDPANSPFRGTELPVYSPALRRNLTDAARVLKAEGAHARRLLGIALPPLRGDDVPALSELLHGLADGAQRDNIAAMGSDILTLCRADERLQANASYYFKHFSALIEPVACSAEERLSRGAEVVRRLKRVSIGEFCAEDIPKYLRTLSEIEQTLSEIREIPAAAHCFDRAGKFLSAPYEAMMAPLRSLRERCGRLFFSDAAFGELCVRAARGGTAVFARAAGAVDGFLSAARAFCAVACLPAPEDLTALERRAGEMLEQADGLAAWCAFRGELGGLRALGLTNVAAEIENGETDGERLLHRLEKHVAGRLLSLYLPEPTLSEPAEGDLLRLSAALAEAVRGHIRAALAARHRGMGEETALRLARAGKSVRALFAAEGEQVLSVCPCVFASPAAVAQYLPPDENFDLVVFDEASQLTTAEAVGSLARARAAIVAGDPKQLPPTSFFLSGESDASVLDDCLCAGMEACRLRVHYRSRHESLIAFSNAAYYGGNLLTVPSPDARAGRVKFVFTAGVYERGGSKRNASEARAVAEEAARRLSDPALRAQSLGIVTFSGAQQEEIERVLSAVLGERGLLRAAYEREEPLFVKNLENVQGDERDVILLSVCYGPDREGKVSLNFGPLNRADGWRRLNVAVSRAREEMLVFSSLHAEDIGGGSAGAKELRAFLEFAEHGVCPLPPSHGKGIGGYIARRLARCGYPCDVNVGASSYKVDVAVPDPRNGERYLMAILSDGYLPAEDAALFEELLRRAGWNVMRVGCVAFYENPDREIMRIKAELDRLTGRHDRARAARRARRYRAVPVSHVCGGEALLREENGEEVCARLRLIVAREQPISRAFLKKRLLATFGISRAGARVLGAIDRAIDGCGLCRDRVHGVDYFYMDRRALGFEKYRTEGARVLRREAEDFTVYEGVAFVRGVLEDGVALYCDELAARFSEACGGRAEALQGFLESCVDYGVEKGILKRTPSDRIALA